MHESPQSAPPDISKSTPLTASNPPYLFSSPRATRVDNPPDRPTALLFVSVLNRKPLYDLDDNPGPTVQPIPTVFRTRLGKIVLREQK